MYYENVLLDRPELHETKLSILQKIATTVPVTDNINVITNRMLTLAVEYAKAEKGSVMLTDEMGELTILAGKDIDTRFIRTHKIKIGEGIAGTIAKQRKPILVTDIENDERFKGKTRNRYKTKSFIACPIVSKNRVLGLININDKKDKTPFTENELILVKIIADQSAIALEKAFLISQVRTKDMEFEEINNNLIDCEVSRTELFTQISHALRTPLHSIKGAVYYLLKADKLTKGEQKEFFGIISNETGNLISIIERFIDFIRPEDKIELTHRTLINIAELIKETVNSKSLQNMVLKKNIQLTIDINDAISNIVGDKIKIRQFFISLIEVICFYHENGDIITISINKNDFVEVTMKLSRKMPEAVFSYLLDTRRTFDFDKPESTIKLYLAKKVAQLHHWNITMGNTDNTPSISIRIPQSTRQKREVVINTTMELFVEFIAEMLDLQTCSIMLYDDLTGDLTIKSSKGLSDDIVRYTRVKPGDKIAGWVVLKGEPLFVKDIESDLSFGKKNIPQYNTNSFISLPLKLQNKIVGVINLSNKKNAKPFTMIDFQIASLMSERISYFIEKLSLSDYNETYFNQFIKSFESLLNIQKKSHKKQPIVSDLIMKMLDVLGVSEADKKDSLYTSVVYDLGLALIDESIFLKKKLSPEELLSLKLHPYNTIFLLDSLELSDVIKHVILHHHEGYDGTGYPDGLKGEEIPFLSRVLSVADAYCAMISERSYREKLTKEQALQKIRQGSGSLYDPNVVKALEEVVQNI